jgi:hypothetical protein
MEGSSGCGIVLLVGCMCIHWVLNVPLAMEMSGDDVLGKVNMQREAK